MEICGRDAALERAFLGERVAGQGCALGTLGNFHSNRRRVGRCDPSGPQHRELRKYFVVHLGDQVVLAVGFAAPHLPELNGIDRHGFFLTFPELLPRLPGVATTVNSRRGYRGPTRGLPTASSVKMWPQGEDHGSWFSSTPSRPHRPPGQNSWTAFCSKAIPHQQECSCGDGRLRPCSARQSLGSSSEGAQESCDRCPRLQSHRSRARIRNPETSRPTLSGSHLRLDARKRMGTGGRDHPLGAINRRECEPGYARVVSQISHGRGLCCAHSGT